MVDFLDKNIQGIIQDRARYQQEKAQFEYMSSLSRNRPVDERYMNAERKKDETEWQSELAKYTFEDAISGVFRMLAGDKAFSLEKESAYLYYPELPEVILKAKHEQATLCESQEDAQRLRAETEAKLNQAIQKFYFTHDPISMIYEVNIENALAYTNSFKSMKSRFSQMVLSWQGDVYQKIKVAFDLANRCGPYANLGKDIKEGLIKQTRDVLSSSAHNQCDTDCLSIPRCSELIREELLKEKLKSNPLEERVRLLNDLHLGLETFIVYQFDLDDLKYPSEIEESFEEFRGKAIQKKFAEQIEMNKIFAEEQSELQQDPDRVAVVDYYHELENRPEFKSIQKAFADIMTNWLTSQFKKPAPEAKKAPDSVKRSRN